MEEIPTKELKNHLNKPLTMIEENKSFDVEIKSTSPTLIIFNKQRMSIMEFYSIRELKFYANGCRS